MQMFRSCRMILHEDNLAYMGATSKLLNEWRTRKGVYNAPLEDYLKECRGKLEAVKYERYEHINFI
jgi:hypothetical protein